MEKYKNIIYTYNAPYYINLTGDEHLHADIAIYVGNVCKDKTADIVKGILSEYKEAYYIKLVGQITKKLFIIVKKVKY